MCPDCNTLSNVPRSGYITARDQSKMESGMTEGLKKRILKPQAKKKTIFKVILEEKQQLVEEKRADNKRRVLCKSFIKWF